MSLLFNFVSFRFYTSMYQIFFWRCKGKLTAASLLLSSIYAYLKDFYCGVTTCLVSFLNQAKTLCTYLIPRWGLESWNFFRYKIPRSLNPSVIICWVITSFTPDCCPFVFNIKLTFSRLSCWGSGSLHNTSCVWCQNGTII